MAKCKHERFVFQNPYVSYANVTSYYSNQDSMNKLLIIIFLFCFISVNSQETLNLDNKVYITGSETHFDNYKKCDFFFECDCCFGEYIFLPGQKFIYIFYCSSDFVLTGGKYKISSDSVILKSTNQRIEINYNWDSEFDENAQKYLINDTIFDHYETNFAIDKCDKLILRDKNISWVAIESTKEISEINQRFKKIGLLKYLEKLKK